MARAITTENMLEKKRVIVSTVVTKICILVTTVQKNCILVYIQTFRP